VELSCESPIDPPLGTGIMRGSIMALQAGTRLGAYEVLSLLGAGGSGEVYRARDTRLNREVAIKVLAAERVTDPDRRRHFVQEAQAASALNHPHIITITRSSRPTITTSS
jgi:serine/threonine protein kinase